MSFLVRPAVEKDVKPIARVMGDYAGVHSSRDRCRRVALRLVHDARRARRKGEQSDVAFVVESDGDVRGFVAGAWGYMHGLFEDVPTLLVTHMGGKTGVLRPLLRRLREEARGGHLVIAPPHVAPYTAKPNAGWRLGMALKRLGFNEIGIAYAMEVPK